MPLWYSIVDYLLPFQWSQHMFMKNALLGVLLITPIFGILGTMVVNNRMAFFSDSIGHSALTGIAIGVILGIKNPLWSMVFFALLLSFAIMGVKRANASSNDTIIGVFSSTAVALGIVILSRNGGFSKYSVYLIGDLLSINPDNLVMLAFVALAVLVLWLAVFNKLLLVSVNPSLASSRGINIRFYESLFTVMMAIIVTIAIEWVGILIISSLLVLPAAASRNIARNMLEYHAYSVLIALVSGLAGLILSYYWGTATGATIVLGSAIFFATTFFFRLRQN